MRRALFLLPLIVLFTALPALTAHNELLATIPFDFIVRGVTMPAGDYTTQPITSGSAWRIGNRDTKHNVAFGGIPETYQPNGAPRLLFHRYGKTYFLHQVQTVSVKITVPETRMELQLRARVGDPVIVAVMVRR